MAQRILAMSLRRLVQSPVGARAFSNAEKVGKREVVGYGVNGMPVYCDRVDYPMPAIRFREETKEILALREKEKGDWNKLTLQEKKALYRASFCQTFAEMQAPTGVWKPCLTGVFVATSLALLIAIFMNTVVYDERPESFNEEHQKAQLKRMLELEINPVHGLSSKWDYENKRWK